MDEDLQEHDHEAEGAVDHAHDDDAAA